MELQALIKDIETNEQAIQSLDAQARPYVEKQLVHAAAAKVERAKARGFQKNADEFLVASQDLRFKNQQLKLEAGQLLLNERKPAPPIVSER